MSEAVVKALGVAVLLTLVACGKQTPANQTYQAQARACRRELAIQPTLHDSLTVLRRVPRGWEHECGWWIERYPNERAP